MKAGEAIGLLLGFISTSATVAWVGLYARSQGTGSLEVTVYVVDSSGKPVQFAVVQLGSDVQVTDDNGMVRFVGVTPKLYRISVVATGFNSISETVEVSPAQASFEVNLSP